jgi:DNA polymerase III subunit beta
LYESDEGTSGEVRVKVICVQENLAHGLGIAGRGVSTRGSLPILGNVLLRTDAGRLRLTATNLEVGINCWVPAKVEDDGAITVPAKLFIDFVNSLPPGNVELSLNVRTKTVHLKSGPYEANIKGMDAEEFPIIPQIPEKPTTRMSQGTLRRMIGEVAFVAATDDSRPVLTGVLTTFAGEMVTMAAADPYRLSVRHARLIDRVDPQIEVIIPAKSLFEVARILTDSDDATVDILVTPNKSQVIFHTDEADLVSRIIEGQFPNYRQVIPTSHATRVLAQREELLKATRLASYFARDAANMLRFQVDPANEPPLVITANAAEVGDNTGRIDATVEGQPTTIAFNSRFVADALSSLTAPEVALELGGPLAPGVVRIVGDDSYLHVVMPLRIPA